MAQSLDISQLIEFNRKLSDVMKKGKSGNASRKRIKSSEKKWNAWFGLACRAVKKVARWQVGHYGSGGGYTAIRAQKGKHDGYAKGYITNAIENGHWSSWTRNFRVRGLGFYAKARSELKQNAQKHAQTLEQKIENELQNLKR